MRLMVFICINRDNSSYIFIDGFITNPKYLIKHPKSKKITSCPQGIELNSYFKLPLVERFIQLYRQSFCAKQNIFKNYEQYCFYKCIDFSKFQKDIGQSKKNRLSDLCQYLPILTTEYDNDLSAGHANYMLNVITIDFPGCSYKTIKSCCANWMKKVGFKLKTRREYLDYDKFTSAWIDILDKFFADINIHIRESNISD